MEQKKAELLTSRIIMILLSLVLVTAFVIGGILIYRALRGPDTAAQLKDNIIVGTSGSETSPGTAQTVMGLAAEYGGEAVGLAFYSDSRTNNEPFDVRNMFPGDQNLKYFAVRVYHEEAAALTMDVAETATSGVSYLPDVLRVKITELQSGRVLYEGPLADLKNGRFTQSITPNAAQRTDCFYEVSTYLPTAVGNEYQRVSYKGDFVWSVEGDLAPNPGTGYYLGAAGALALALVSLLLMILLKKRRGKHADENQASA